MRQNLFIYILLFLFYLGLQVFLFNNMVLFDTAFCFIYIAFILFLPFDINPIILIIIGFLLGIITDLFYSSMGVNAAATVLISFIRKPWISIITPRGGYEEIISPIAGSLGFTWFISYIFPLTLFHHLALFQIEAGRFLITWFIFKKVILSSIFTTSVLILIKYLFYRNPRAV